MLANFLGYLGLRSTIEEKEAPSFPHTEVPNEITLLFLYKLAEQAKDQKELIKNLFNASLIFSGGLKKDSSVNIRNVSSFISGCIEDGLIHYWNLGKPVESHENLESLFSQKGARVKQLALNQISISLSILEACPNLNSLKIRECFDDISLKILADYKCATKLQSLKITSSLPLNESCFQSLIKFTALKALELQVADIKIDLTNLKSLPLKKLNLSSSIVDERDLKGLSSLTTLKKLTLGSVNNEQFISFFPKLKLNHLSLTLTNFQNETVEILKNSPSLKTLNLGRTNISNSSLETLCTHPNLKVLKLSKNPFVKPSIIKAIETSNLTRVTFKNCLHMRKDRFSSSFFDIIEKKKGHLELIRK